MPGLIVSFMLAAIAAVQLSVSPGTGRVVGRVVDSVTGSPVAGVSVSLQGPVSPTAPWPPTIPSLPPQGGQTAPLAPRDPNTLLIITRLRTETNADGIFEIHDVPDGRWVVHARKDGYVGGSIVSLPGPLIEMVGGRSVTAPDVRLDRGGAVTGRLLDARGNPMSGVTVVAMQLRRLANGTVQPGGIGANSRTNDLGEYRLSGLAPGEHYVVAQTPPRAMGIGAVLSTAPAPAASTYVTTYFPGSSDAAIASPVTVVRGGTTAAIDFSMQSVPAYQVLGTVVDAGGRPVSGAIVRLAPRQAGPSTSIQSEPTDASGKFRVTNVPAGTYGAMAAVPVMTKNASGGMSGTLSFGDAARPGAAPEVTIQSDVTNLRVVVSQR